MAPKHRRPARLSPRARRTLVGLTMVAVLGPVAGVSLGTAIGEVRSCEDDMELSVAVAPELAPAMDKYASIWEETAAPAEGKCVKVDVQAIDSPSMATAFAESADMEIDVGDAKVKKVDQLPDIWVPESMVWLARLGNDLDGRFDERVDSVAESSVGLAAPETKEYSQTSGMLSQTSVSAGDPHSDPAALSLELEKRSKNGPKVQYAEQGPKLMSRAEVDQHNSEHDKKLSYMDATPALPAYEYPYVTMSDAKTAVDSATNAFRDGLVGKTFINTLAEYGMRKAGPYPAKLDPEAVERALDK